MATMTTLPPYLTLEETAELLRVSPQTFAGWWHNEPDFPRPRTIGTRRLLFRLADIDAYMAKTRRGTSE
jgi:predicted DNA-binding transcriptional regulator AlpA